ncbi:S8 family serine peptidase [Brevibacillus porteri]|uniref:Fibronectin type-III domain-containing protein n=1 Tax=Brevibacillus porteri TaxID=2126350 RepID=A0ABX5FQV0_9BACL|nr:S8 family serine peptidase [Brevibacillus porteri]MED1800551.1 S8 family serine peptidase [Brevibacillus porteri]MED2132734.1 S8 family serine peptidase [Brevibacillus porteri]MED2743257.1 S8 family serine peptidase [Brevibacillus porteri]MED2816217.1 S8 family serine peptidase [Brevibacillus porteri]MED2894059.1 S8 family serine peptidase [Brevibacillus porteri]
MSKKELRNRDCSKKIAQRYIVNFIDGVSEKEQDKIIKQFGGKVLKKFRTPAFDRFAVVHIDDEQVEQLLAHNLVESIDQDTEAESPSSTEVETWAHATAQAFNFWNAGYTGAGVKVAIIDTGVTPHPDLPTPLSTWNVVTDSTDATDVSPDNHGHGTCSAGVIAARNNGSYVKGIAYDSDIHVINCYYQKEGDTQDAYTNLSYTAEALQYAATLDVDVVLCNVQLSSGGTSLQAACDALEAKGIPILAAAGNYPDKNGDVTKDTVRYPGHYDKVVAAGAVEIYSDAPYLTRANYSGTGPYLDIASFTGLVTTSKSGGYNYHYSGTSCATPFATGVMALLKQAYPNYTAKQLRDKLYEGATPYGTTNEYGVGLIGLPASLLPSNTLEYPVLTASTTEDFSDSNFNFNLSGDFVIGTDSGRTVLRTPAYSNTGTGISRFTFQVPANAVNPQISITHRSDCRATDNMLVTVNGRPLTYASRIKSNYETDTLPLQPSGKYLVELRWDKYESYSLGLNAVFIDSISVNFTTSGSGGGTLGDSFTNPIVVSGTTASGTLQDTKDLYFKYTASSTGSYNFTTSASFDSYMQLLDSSQNILAQDDDSAGSSQPKITYNLSAGQVVYLKVYGYNHGAGKYGPITLNITAPSVGSVPSTASVSIGSPSTSSLTLNMSATGATSFNVYRSASPSGTYSLVASGVTSPYTNTGLSSNTTYYYKVAGVNSYGTGPQSSYATGTTNSSGGVTPITIVEDFSDGSFDPRLNLSLGGWEYDSSVGSISAIVADSTGSKSVTLNVDIPSGTTSRTLKLDHKGMLFGGSSGVYHTQVFVNGILKHTFTESDVQWRTQTINLGTGNQAIEIRASSTSSTWVTGIDNIVVSWR